MLYCVCFFEIKLQEIRNVIVQFKSDRDEKSLKKRLLDLAEKTINETLDENEEDEEDEEEEGEEVDGGGVRGDEKNGDDNEDEDDDEDEDEEVSCCGMRDGDL